MSLNSKMAGACGVFVYMILSFKVMFEINIIIK